MSDHINKRQGDDIVALLQDLARGGISVEAIDTGSSIPDNTLEDIGAIREAVEYLPNAQSIEERLDGVWGALNGISDSMMKLNAWHHAEADDRAKQRRYMRFNLVQDIADWERRVVEDDDTLHAEGMLLRLREELEVLDDLWPDTAAVALVAVQR